MSDEGYWHRRLTEVTLKASLAENQRLREIYTELAAHYVSMDQLCGSGLATKNIKLTNPFPTKG